MAAEGVGWQDAGVMNPPMNDNNGADAGFGADGGEAIKEPLFGDARWIRERMEAMGVDGSLPTRPPQDSSSLSSST